MKYFVKHLFFEIILIFWMSGASAQINNISIKLGEFEAEEIDSITVYLWIGVDLIGSQSALIEKHIDLDNIDGSTQVIWFMAKDNEIVIPENARYVATQAIGYSSGYVAIQTPFTVRSMAPIMTDGHGQILLEFQTNTTQSLRQTAIFQTGDPIAAQFEINSSLISNAIFHLFSQGLVVDSQDYALITDFLKHSNHEILALSQSDRDFLFGILIGIFNDRISGVNSSDTDAFLELFVQFTNNLLTIETTNAEPRIMLRPDKVMLQAMTTAYIRNISLFLNQVPMSLRSLRDRQYYSECISLAAEVMDSLDHRYVSSERNVQTDTMSFEQVEGAMTVMRLGQECVRLDVARAHPDEIGILILSQNLDLVQHRGKLAQYYSDEQTYGNFNRYFLSVFDALQPQMKPDTRLQYTEIVNYRKILDAGLPSLTQ